MVFVLGSIRTATKFRFGVSWLALALIFGALFIQMIRESNLARAQLFAMSAIVTLLMWTFLLAYYQVFALPIVLILFGLVLFVQGQLPLSPLLSLVPASLAILSALVSVLSRDPNSQAACVFVLLASAAYLRGNSISYFSASSRAAWLALSRVADSLSAWGALWMATETLRRISGARDSYVFLGGDSVYRCTGSRLSLAEELADEAQAFHEYMIQLSKEGGILSPSIFSGMVKSTFRKLTQGSVRRAYFLKLDIVLQEEERTAILISPLSVASLVAGKDRGFRSVFSVGSVVRLFFRVSGRDFIQRTYSLLLSEVLQNVKLNSTK